MKVLFIQKVKGFSGSEKFIHETMPVLSKKGIEVHLLAVYLEEAHLDNFAYRFEEIGAHVIYLKASSDLNGKLLRDIHAIIKAGEYDLIHTHLIHADIWIALIKTFLNRKLKVVSTKHNYDEGYMNQFGFDPKGLKWTQRYYFLSYLAEKKMDFSITISEGLYNLYDKGKITPKDRLRAIPYGFDLPDFDPPETSDCRLAPQQLIIVGRLLPLKGHKFVINIMPLLLKVFPELKLVIVGDGEEKENLRKLVASKELQEQVVFAGYQKNVLEWMNYSDIVLIPSTSEGFGIVILEANNSRTPVIAFDVPAPNEIVIHGETGLLVPPFDLEILEEEILHLLRHPEKGNMMAEKAYDRLKSYFTSDRMTREIIEVYRQVLEA